MHQKTEHTLNSCRKATRSWGRPGSATPTASSLPATTCSRSCLGTCWIHARLSSRTKPMHSRAGMPNAPLWVTPWSSCIVGSFLHSTSYGQRLVVFKPPEAVLSVLAMTGLPMQGNTYNGANHMLPVCTTQSSCTSQSLMKASKHRNVARRLNVMVDQAGDESQIPDYSLHRTSSCWIQLGFPVCDV